MRKGEWATTSVACPGVKLLLVDDIPPEDSAMLQALYSRSAESAETHLDKVKHSSSKWLNQFYVNYGHKSIADCGSTTMFIEGVSTLAAKAFQDWPLYSGQETSTRYIDMSKQRIVDPVNTPASKAILDRWMEFYVSKQEQVIELVRKQHPKRENEKEETYEKAVKARSFDILRAFLPAGITTQLSWHTNLRQAGDHLNLLAKHPVQEIRQVAAALQEMLHAQYPASGTAGLASVSGVGAASNGQERADWERRTASEYTYTGGMGFCREPTPLDSVFFADTIDKGALSQFQNLLDTRPKGCVLPHFLSDLGQLAFNFLLDFGSFRDIQRHRNGVCRMPLLTTGYGFEHWYLNQLIGHSRDVTGYRLNTEANKLIEEQIKAIDKLDTTPAERQNYIPLGFRVPTQVTYALPAAVYVMELRSTKTVHPSLRNVVQRMIKIFELKHPNVPLHVDRDEDDWTVRRGEQDIKMKAQS